MDPLERFRDPNPFLVCLHARLYLSSRWSPPAVVGSAPRGHAAPIPRAVGEMGDSEIGTGPTKSRVYGWVP